MNWYYCCTVPIFKNPNERRVYFRTFVRQISINLDLGKNLGGKVFHLEKRRKAKNTLTQINEPIPLCGSSSVQNIKEQTHNTMRSLGSLLTFLTFLLFHRNTSAMKTSTVPPITPISTDAITCSIEDCALMCICQKLLWIIDYNHPDAALPTDEICLKWADSKLMAKDAKGEECLTGCLVIAQFIDAAAGRDPYICQRARDAVTSLGAINKELK